MKYFSAFSGIGGFELGIERAYELQKLGTEPENSTDIKSKPPQHSVIPLCIGYSEIDKYAIQIYERHFNHKNYGDITKIIATDLPDFDLFVGGFPCQAFSIAGKRRGFDDTRGTLFFDIARILKEKHPRNFLLENVKGLLSHDNGRTFKTIIATLVELGYGVEWQVLNSKNFGVPQNRERVFIVGHLGGFSGRKVFPFYEFNPTALNYIGAIMSEKNQKWLDDGKQLSRNFPQGQRVYASDGISSTLASQAGGLGAKTGLYAVPLKFLERNQKNYQGKYSFTVDTANTGGVMKDMRIRRLTPTECERLQGFPEGWTEGISDSQRYKCLGNAVTVNVVQAVVHTLNAHSTHSLQNPYPSV